MKDVVTGSVEGTGAAINVSLGFIPSAVEITNIDDVKGIYPTLLWNKFMAAASAFKTKVNSRLSDGGLAIGSVSKKEVLVAATVDFIIDGINYAKTTAEAAFTATTDDITAVAASVQEAVYLVCVSSGGTLSIVKGTTATGSGEGVIPGAPLGLCVIGTVRIAVDAGATDFDATSDDLDAAHLTVTYVDYNIPTPSLVTSNGISEFAGTKATLGVGFTIGADTDVNVLAETIYYKATR